MSITHFHFIFIFGYALKKEELEKKVPYHCGTIPFFLEERQFANSPLTCEGGKLHFPPSSV